MILNLKKMSSVKIELTLKKDEKGVTLVMRNREFILSQCEQMFLKGIHEVDLTAELKRQTKPSNKQLAFYFREIIPKCVAGLKDAGYMGIDLSKAHDYLKDMFFCEILEGINSDYIRIPRSLSTATSEELTEYIEKCITFITSELNVRIVSPDEYKQNK